MRRAPALFLTAAFVLAAVLSCSGDEPAPAPPAASARATFVDEAQCALCHAGEARAWAGTDHDRAMQDATDATVLGDFDGARLEHAGEVTTFARRDGKFLVTTTGTDGAPAEFEVRHTFGIDPLQQYLVALPGGRLQALRAAWDVRGKRWFHLYGDERIAHDDELHWTAPAQNWNYMCAECHATGLVRGWDEAAQTYSTTAHRFDVGCQACHGPASGHMAWVERHKSDPQAAGSPAGRGFPIALAARESRVEVETCARCHARRTPLGDGFRHANRLMDDYLPALLDPGLYFADGQIQDEVYEYGSFLQSKMHAAGMRCSDCHDPHSTRLRAEGNALCTSCHNETGPAAREHVDVSKLQRKDYDSRAHHHHEPGTAGARCVSCHAPERTYMEVDPRRDHSFRVPRPDLSMELGTPHACADCHEARGASWAASVIDGWRAEGAAPAPHYGRALHAGRTGAPGAADLLLGVTRDPSVPAIARATALGLAARYPGAPATQAIGAGLADPDPLVRHAAAVACETLPLAELPARLAPLVSDPVRAVRIEAARQLVAGSPTLGAATEPWKAAIEEYVAVQRALFDRPEGHANLAMLRAEQGRDAEAEQLLRAAIRMDPRFVPAYVNLAEVLRGKGSEAGVEDVLREGLRVVRDSAPLHHALGLCLIRQRKNADGLVSLATAAELAPDDARLGYVHAIALHDLVGPAAGSAELERVLSRQPMDRAARLTLAEWRARAGDAAGAAALLAELRRINPYDPALEKTDGAR